MDENANDERMTRYIEALATTPGAYAQDADYARAVIAVADAEQAELREQRAEWMRVARDRMAERDAAEAKVARVEALVEQWESDRDVCLAWIDNPAMHVDEGHPARLSVQAYGLNRRAVEIRDALDGSSAMVDS